MTTVKVTIDKKTPGLDAGASQIAFAISKAINDSMVTAQKKQIAHDRKVFTVRRGPFVDRSVKITKFAKKFDLVGIIAMHPPGDAKQDIFDKFEAGGTKTPRSGKLLAIPVTGGAVKPTKTSIVAEKNKPKVLLAGLTSFTNRQGKQQPIKRAKSFGGAFILPARNGKPAEILIRKGKKTQVAYVLEPKAPIKPVLDFESIITTSIKQTFADDFAPEFANAVKTARK